MRKVPAWLSPLVVSAALLWVVAPQYFREGLAARVLEAAAWIALVLAGHPRASPTMRLGLAGIAGSSGGVLWNSSPEGWARVVAVIGIFLLLHPSPRREIAALCTAVVVPLMLLVGTLVFGLEDARRALLWTLAHAASPLETLATDVAAISAAFWLSTRLWNAERAISPGRSVLAITLLATAVVFALFMRARVTIAEARLPFDARQWSEPPLLLDVLKRARGVPIYGEPNDVNSFTYSSTFELLNAALLSPFRASLLIRAHRALGMLWQAAAAIVLGWAVSPKLAEAHRRDRWFVWALAASTFLCLEWASPSSPFLHPDPPLQAVVAMVVAVALRSDHDRSRAFRLTTALAPPVAAAFKLTGAGVGVGLAISALIERRRTMIVPLAIGGALSIAIVPTYDALFGRFSEYAVRLMASHDFVPSRVWDAALAPQGRFMALAIVLVLATGPRPRSAISLAGFMVGLGAVTGLAFLKEGGRSNNLVAPALVAVSILYVVLAEKSVSGVTSAAAVSALVVVTTGPLGWPDTRALDAARTDHRIAVAFVRGELERRRNPLVQYGTTIWLEAGGAGVPGDQVVSAVELYLARHPAYERYLVRLASGTYGSIVTPAMTFVARTSDGRTFGEEMRRAVNDRYCVVYPLGPDRRAAPLTTGGEHLMILQRRDYGCAPLVSDE